MVMDYKLISTALVDLLSCVHSYKYVTGRLVAAYDIQYLTQLKSVTVKMKHKMGD
jgi:hypothetical protein